MRAYWYFEYNEVDPRQRMVMEHVIYLSRNRDKEELIRSENDEDIYI